MRQANLRACRAYSIRFLTDMMGTTNDRNTGFLGNLMTQLPSTFASAFLVFFEAFFSLAVRSGFFLTLFLLSCPLLIIFTHCYGELALNLLA